MNYKQFYKALGKLLYSVAASDGKIHPNEVKKLRDLVSHDISAWESHTDAFGTDMAFYTEFEFETLLEQALDFHQTYQEFIDFVNTYPKSISPQLRQLIVDVALKVANAYSGINKTEIHFILNLKKDLGLISTPTHSS